MFSLHTSRQGTPRCPSLKSRRRTGVSFAPAMDPKGRLTTCLTAIHNDYAEGQCKFVELTSLECSCNRGLSAGPPHRPHWRSRSTTCGYALVTCAKLTPIYPPSSRASWRHWKVTKRSRTLPKIRGSCKSTGDLRFTCSRLRSSDYVTNNMVHNLMVYATILSKFGLPHAHI